jgi:Kef-type K+ transport system membrane component KefB
VPVALAFAASVAQGGSPLRSLPVPHALALGGALVLGPLLGGLGAVLLGEAPGPRELWGTLLGISALAVGLSDRFGVSVVAVLFALGATLARVTRHREELVHAVAPTERALLLPLLVVIGVRIDVAQGLVLGALAAGLGALRVAAHAGLLSGLWGAKTRYVSGISSLSTTPLVVLIAAAAAPVATDGTRDVLLPCAFVLAVLGEVASPLALRAVHRLEPGLAAPVTEEDVPS